jgi:hypothetical protein
MIEIHQLLSANNSFAAIEHIQSHGTPIEIATRYATLVTDFYWKAHDLPAVVTLGRAGIYFCLGHSHTAGLSVESVDKFRSAAKGLAYNVGSFTWPGWDEPGIHPDPVQIAFGAECAALNLRLALELRKPISRVSFAHWLVAAHALATGDLDQAEREFELAHKILPETGATEKSLQQMNRGYLAIARLCRNPSDADLAATFADIISRLNSQSDEDAKQYAAQLLKAQRFFTQSRGVSPR